MTDVIGTEQVAKATALLQRYKTGKAALDKRIVDNELWFRMQHWANYQNEMMEGKPKPSSGWLFNSIANKHADAMDNYPEPNVLPLLVLTASQPLASSRLSGVSVRLYAPPE